MSADRLFVTAIHNGDYKMVQCVDFGRGTHAVEVSISPIFGGSMEIRKDHIDRPIVASIDVSLSREAGIW